MSEFPAVLSLSELGGRFGHSIGGATDGARAGVSVSSAGDLNGDGVDDFIVGAEYADRDGSATGAAYVVFGRAGAGPAIENLSDLDGATGFAFFGTGAGHGLGFDVAAAGDVNGDGLADLIVSAGRADEAVADHGAAYVVFGSRSGFAAIIDPRDLTLDAGFRIDGAASGSWNGWSVAGIGDINGDGIDDIAMGAPELGGDRSGGGYVLFGTRSGFPTILSIAALDGTNGFVIGGGAALEQIGASLSGAGDVNGDGIADLIVGGYGETAGASYLIYGRNTGFDAEFDPTAINGANGTVFLGSAPGQRSISAVASAGDVNGDGFDDLVIGAFGVGADANYSGESYVVFGRAGGLGPSVELSELDEESGFALFGRPGDFSGTAVSSAGDVDGDGFDDLIIGARGADDNGSSSGSAYVVFGRASGFAARLDLSALDGTDGFRIDGISGEDIAGASVSAAGDVNGDGFDDILVGAYGADGAVPASGAAYLIYGRAPDGAVTRNGTESGNTISGGALGDVLNGLGGDDTLMGNGGNDLLNGGTGSDLMIGGAGSDTYVVDAAGDGVVETGAGSDTVRSSVSLTLSAGVETLTLLGSSGLKGTGNTLANTLTGNAGNNALQGAAGNDTLSGNGGRDTLDGGTGNDTLDGGLLADTLKGGAGRDSFVFDAKPSTSNVDRILDFRAADDTIRLDDRDFAGLARGALKASAFKDIADGKVDRDDRILYDSDNGDLFFDRNGSAAGGRVKFADLVNEADLTHRDFLVF